MRTAVLALFVPLFALAATLGSSRAAEDTCFKISDSAICLAAAPKCHWVGEERDCLDGPPPPQDACRAHGDRAICDSDATLGCGWDAARGCLAKAD